jgi:hypothetical protein
VSRESFPSLRGQPKAFQFLKSIPFAKGGRPHRPGYARSDTIGNYAVFPLSAG